MKLIQFLIQTNMFIAIAAVLFTMESQVQLGMGIAFRFYLLIIFFSAMFEYNLHRLITLIYYPNALQSPKHKWLRDHKTVFDFVFIFSTAGFIISLLFQSREVLAALLPIAIVTILYTFPIHLFNKKLRRIREISGLKIFIIALVWSTVSVLLPVVHSGSSFDSTHIALIIIERFLFIFAITIPFDIRDLQVDSQAGLKTIPTIYGVKKALFFANMSIIGFILVSIWHYFNISMFFLLPPLILNGVLTFICLNSKRLQQSPYYHYGYLDGTIAIQALLVLISYSIN